MDPLEAVGGVPQNLQQSFRFARYLDFPHSPARVIHNAEAGLLDRKDGALSFPVLLQ